MPEIKNFFSSNNISPKRLLIIFLIVAIYTGLLFALSYWFFEKSGKFPPEVETKYITNTVVKESSPSATPSVSVEKKEPTAKEYLKVPWVTYKSDTFKFSIEYPYNMPVLINSGELIKDIPLESVILNGKFTYDGSEPKVAVYGNFQGGVCHDTPTGSCKEEQIIISGKKGSRWTQVVDGKKGNVEWYWFDGPKELKKEGKVNNRIIFISLGVNTDEKKLVDKMISTLTFFD